MKSFLVLPTFPGPTWWREAGVSIGHSGQRSTGAETRELCEGEVTWNVLKEGRYWDRWRLREVFPGPPTPPRLLPSLSSLLPCAPHLP